jgi:hypothetical protein
MRMQGERQFGNTCVKCNQGVVPLGQAWNRRWATPGTKTTKKGTHYADKHCPEGGYHEVPE